MQTLIPELSDFIENHLASDTHQLLLCAHRYPEIDMQFAVSQIMARKHIRDKLPAWYAERNIIYPSALAAEQCSSEITASYKQQLIEGNSVCDLTGGLGIDSWYFSQVAREVTYIERYPEYCEAAAHNFSCLGSKNIRIVCADCRDILPELTADTFYMDPARRSGTNKRLFAIHECEPNALELKDILLPRSKRLLIKLSPMADITETLRLLPETRDVHILSVKNECKEVLFVLCPLQHKELHEVRIHAVHYSNREKVFRFIFTREEEKEAEVTFANTVKTYLYEPYAALLKSGAFKLTGKRYGLEKLHLHSHLYTSDQYSPDFPGRKFQVINLYPFTRKTLKQLSQHLPQANITIRNFPVSVNELRKKSGIAEGGEIYLFATTLCDTRHILIECKKV